MTPRWVKLLIYPKHTWNPNKNFSIQQQDLSYKDKHWHEACFLCNMCRVSLVDKQFGSKADKIYCGNCYDSQFASRCDGCGEVFRAGKWKYIYFLQWWCKFPILSSTNEVVANVNWIFLSPNGERESQRKKQNYPTRFLCALQFHATFIIIFIIKIYN